MDPFLQNTAAYLGALACIFIGVSITSLLHLVIKTDRGSGRYGWDESTNHWDYYFFLAIVGGVGAGFIVAGIQIVTKFIV